MKKNKDREIINKFLNFIEKEVIPPIKKDFTWLGKIINEDLENLTKEKKQSKTKKNKSNK